MSGRPRDDIVGKVMTSFGLEDLRAAANRLYKGKWCQPQISVPNTTRPDYSRKLAEAVYDGLLSIQNQDQLRVFFWVSGTLRSWCRQGGWLFLASMSPPEQNTCFGLV